MPLDVKHLYVSPIPSNGDPSIVQGPDWNAPHKLEQGGAALLGRADATSGATQEIPLDPATMAFVDGKLTGLAVVPDLSDYVTDSELADAIAAIPPTSWNDITDLPATFPPTLPIPWTGITDKPATFPPSAHVHPQSEITNLVSDLALKAPLASPVFTGDPTAPTPVYPDNDLSIANTEYVTTAIAAIPPSGALLTGFWNYNTAALVPPPASGRVRMSVAWPPTLGASIHLYIHNTDVDGFAYTWALGPNIGALIVLRSAGGARLDGTVTAKSTSTYLDITLTVTAVSGTWVNNSRTQISAIQGAPVAWGDIVGASEGVDDRVAALLVAGANVTLTYDDPANTLTIASTAAGGGGGTVTNVSVVNANGLNGSVANPTTAPAITLSTTISGMLKGNATAISAAVAGTDYVTPGGLTTALGSYLPLAGGIVTGTITSTLGTTTVSKPAIDITETWNAGAVTFDVIKATVTRTAAADPSYLIRLLMSSTTMFSVDRFGTGIFNAGVFMGGDLAINTGNAIPAGGTLGRGINMSTTANFGLYFGSGAPNKAQARGSWYMRSDANASTPPFYFNIDGTTGGWLALPSMSTLGSYLPLAGGTLTGALNGTTAAFSSSLTAALAQISNATNGVRIVPGTGLSTIMGTDQTGTGSYQPLVMDGSTLTFNLSGVQKGKFDGSGLTLATPLNGTTGNFSGDLTTATRLLLSGGGASIVGTDGNAVAIATPAGGNLASIGFHATNINCAVGSTLYASALSATSVTAGSGGVVAGGLGVQTTLGGGNFFAFHWDSTRAYYNINNASGWLNICRGTDVYFCGVSSGVGGPSNWAWSAVNSANTVGITCYADGASDARLKKDIADTKVDALAAILAIPVREFTWKGEALTQLTSGGVDPDDNTKILPSPVQDDLPVSLGLIAQEVQPIISDMVGVAANQPNPNLPDDLLLLNLKQGVPYLIKAIQQLTARVAELEAKLV